MPGIMQEVQVVGKRPADDYAIIVPSATTELPALAGEDQRGSAWRTSARPRKAGREHIGHRFLITRDLRDHLRVRLEVPGGGEGVIAWAGILPSP